MAQGATMYVFEVRLADADRNVYETLTIRTARHPSETAEYLLTRLLAYCLEYTEGIAMSKGLSDPDEPAIAVREGRASELLMTGDFIDAAEAHRIGLYNRVVALDKVVGEATAFAEKLAKGPAFGIEMTKVLLNREASLDFWSALDLEAEAQAACMMHPDFREAYHAFRDKRPAKFR